MLQSLPVLDVTVLKCKQLSAAVRLFNKMNTRELKPLNEIDRDAARLELDYEFGENLLRIPKTITAVDGPLQTLREKLAQEPSIRGSKEGLQGVRTLKKPAVSVKEVQTKQLDLGLNYTEYQVRQPRSTKSTPA
jgi:hypothetical protein